MERASDSWHSVNGERTTTVTLGERSKTVYQEAEKTGNGEAKWTSHTNTKPEKEERTQGKFEIQKSKSNYLFVP
jgi:hypothetical protein